MSVAIANKPRLNQAQRQVLDRIAELRQDLNDLVDCLDLLEARVQNRGKQRYNTAQVKKILRLN